MRPRQTNRFVLSRGRVFCVVSGGAFAGNLNDSFSGGQSEWN